MAALRFRRPLNWLAPDPASLPIGASTYRSPLSRFGPPPAGFVQVHGIEGSCRPVSPYMAPVCAGPTIPRRSSPRWGWTYHATSESAPGGLVIGKAVTPSRCKRVRSYGQGALTRRSGSFTRLTTRWPGGDFRHRAAPMRSSNAFRARSSRYRRRRTPGPGPAWRSVPKGRGRAAASSAHTHIPTPRDIPFGNDASACRNPGMKTCGGESKMPRRS